MLIEVVHGRHDIDPLPRACGTCNGQGYVFRLLSDPRTITPNIDPREVVLYERLGCERCHGTGRYLWFSAYTYACAEAVAVGDIVLVPATEGRPEREATVVRLGSDYVDRVTPVLGVIERRSAP